MRAVTNFWAYLPLNCLTLIGTEGEELLHGDTQWLAAGTPHPAATTSGLFGGITSEAEEQELETLNQWVEDQGLPRGLVAFDYADPQTGAQKAVFDLAWPEGLQPGLTGPAVVLLNETAEVLALASSAGYRCFTVAADFQAYVNTEILNSEAT